MVKECKHENARSLFAKLPTKWLRTGYVYCIDCKKVLEKKFEEVGD